jgi:hypothetical protein
VFGTARINNKTGKFALAMTLNLNNQSFELIFILAD